MTPAGSDPAAKAAMLCAAAMIAQQVGAKATRDAIFLSSFDVTTLPTMVVVSALVSIAFVFGASRVMTAVGPGRLVPIAFGVSGALLLGEWPLAREAPRLVAVAVYLQLATFGSVLISGFWSLVSERFDPRMAKRSIGRIAGAGTLGGLIGGVSAERVAALLGVASVLPLLALLHVACAFGVRLLKPREGPARGEGEVGEPSPPALRLVRDDAFLRSLALLVLAGSVASALTDYVFKSQAVAFYAGGAPLMRFFAVFYTATGLLAFLIQISLGRLSLERLGLARTVATLPLAVVTGGLGSLVAPGLASAGGLRGAESVFRGSLYRLGYELLYTPLPPAHKRATKTLLDVGLDRMGDVLGAGLVRAALAAAPQGPVPALSGLAVAVGLVSIWIARSLDRSYLEVLKKSLLSRAAEIGVSSVPVPVLGAADTLDTGLFLLTVGVEAPSEVRRLTPEPPKPPTPAGPPPLEGTLARLVELRSGDPARVRRALRAERSPDLLLVPQAISLLAWDEVGGDAIHALQGIAPRIAGQLGDALCSTRPRSSPSAAASPGFSARPEASARSRP